MYMQCVYIYIHTCVYTRAYLVCTPEHTRVIDGMRWGPFLGFDVKSVEIITDIYELNENHFKTITIWPYHPLI